MAWLDMPQTVRSKFTIFGFGDGTPAGIDSELDQVRAWIANIWTTGAGQSILQASASLITINREPNGSEFDGFRTLGAGLVQIKMGGLAAQGEIGFLTKDGYYVQ